MFQNMEKITELEKVAVFYLVATGCKDRSLIYKIANGESKFNKLSNSSKGATISRWFNLPRIQEQIKIETYNQERKRIEEREKYSIFGETETAEPKPERAAAAAVDFLNRDEFLKFLNERANQIADDKQRNDILKMLSDNMRYKEAENQEQTEIQRFYTPIDCTKCEIYNRCKGCNLDKCEKA